MRLALGKAEEAFSLGEVPVGAVLVEKNEIIASGHNTKETQTDPTGHAEITVIREGARIKGDWRLDTSTLYVTKEPCVMCAGAMMNARLGRLVYGCRDSRYGAVTSRYQISSDPGLNHRVRVVSAVLEQDCSALLKRFFQNMRTASKNHRAERQLSSAG